MTEDKNVIMTEDEPRKVSVGLTAHVLKGIADMIEQIYPILKLLPTEAALESIVDSLREQANEAMNNEGIDEND